MGRQLQIALTDEMESKFLEYLKQSAEIQLFLPFSKTKEGLFVDHFETRGDDHWSYYIWNKNFNWEPVFAQTSNDLDNIESRNLFYVENKTEAPILEYTRHNFEEPTNQGRIYWSKYFAAPNGLLYDVDKFEEWYESVIRWLRQQKKL